MTEPKPPWKREGAALISEWKFADFAEALAFVNKVGEASEAAMNRNLLLRPCSWRNL
ncbi:MAG: 4a-hydroxytetrahydrobiopterin dehydratase [Actinobacteria bacterium]|nr:4a-hydroxytetrahydrobiopterin dehydratase [Actinomycetota bacterium]